MSFRFHSFFWSALKEISQVSSARTIAECYVIISNFLFSIFCFSNCFKIFKLFLQDCKIREKNGFGKLKYIIRQLILLSG